MDLARHSDINLTMSRYSHTVLEQRAEAVAMLPALRVGLAVAVATGRAGPESGGDLSYRSAVRLSADSGEQQRTGANSFTREKAPSRSGGMADAVDSKSTAFTGMRVRLPPPAF